MNILVFLVHYDTPNTKIVFTNHINHYFSKVFLFSVLHYDSKINHNGILNFPCSILKYILREEDP